MTSTSKTMFFTNDKYASRFIRGQQIAAKLGCPINKTLTDDIKNLVFVKCFPRDIAQLYRDYSIWIDTVDSDSILPELVKYPRINVIAISRTAVDYLQARIPNHVVYLPEHHCNFDNEIIPHRSIETVGFIGYAASFDLPFNAVSFALKDIGLRFITLLVDENTTRENVISFYKDIDVQLCFRAPRLMTGMPPEMKNPLKVINAASFGIPTVSYPEISYMKEFVPYLTAKTMEDIVGHFDRMKSMNTDVRHQLVEKAKPYHIDNVVEMYRDILGE